MHIGLIGGIGVAATVLYYQRLTAAVAGMGARLELSIAHGDIQTLIRNATADDKAAQAAVYARHIRQLHGAGCDCAAITSLGGHFCFEETLSRSSLPLISGVAPLDDAFAARGIGCIGLLGTKFVTRSRLYGQLHRTRAVVLDDEIDALGQTYQDIAVAGACTEDQREVLIDAGARMVRDLGAEAVLLAGTDLNLAFDGQDTGYPLIDAVDIHVGVLADLAMGRRSLEETRA